MLFKALTPTLPLEVGWLNQSTVNRGVIPTWRLNTLLCGTVCLRAGRRVNPCYLCGAGPIASRLW